MNLLDLPDDVLISTILQFLVLPRVLFQFLKVSKYALSLKEKIVNNWKVQKIVSNRFPVTPRLVILEQRTYCRFQFHYLDYRAFSVYLKSLTLDSSHNLSEKETEEFMERLKCCINLINLDFGIHFLEEGRMLELPYLPKLRSLYWAGNLAIPKDVKYLYLACDALYDISALTNLCTLVYLQAPYENFDLEIIPEFFSNLKGLSLYSYTGKYVFRNEIQFLEELKAPGAARPLEASLPSELIYFRFFGDTITENPAKIISFIERHPKLKYYSSEEWVHFHLPLIKVFQVELEFRHYGNYNKIVVSGRCGDRIVDILEERVS